MWSICSCFGRRRGKLLTFCLQLFAVFSTVLLLCEYVIYYIVIYQCSWPSNKIGEIPTDLNGENGTLKAMFVADTHLLGNIKGHWFDKLRREWQMHRAFQTAVYLFRPEAIFFLGDVFDEGQWVSEEYFNKYVARFYSLFYVPAAMKIFVVAGNHDLGFHYVISPYLNRRFNKAFNASSVRLVRLKESNFVLINSMAMHKDGCFLCGPAISELRRISAKLQCESDPAFCLKANVTSSKSYSRPIILQHFPLYRESDQMCVGEDTAPFDEKKITFRQNFDCLSNSSSQLLLELLQPRLIMSGHTHHYCLVRHVIHDKRDLSDSVLEYSVPSFSWRNRNDPSFFLGLVTKDDYNISKCYMPQESTVTQLYLVGLLVALYIIFKPLYYYFRNIFRLRIRILTVLAF